MVANDGINDSSLNQHLYTSNELGATPLRPTILGMLAANSDGSFRWDGGAALGPLEITFSLAGAGSIFNSAEYVHGPHSALPAGVVDWTSSQVSEVISILKLWESYSNIRFIGVDEKITGLTQAGDIRIGLTTAIDDKALTFLPAGRDSAIDGDVWINAYSAALTSFISSEARSVLLHELGHALFGFADISTYGANSTNNNTPQYTGLDGVSLDGTAWDASYWSIMSYNTPVFSGSVLYAITPMYLDILAAEALYGPVTNAGSNHYSAYAGSLQTFHDHGGNDSNDSIVWSDDTPAYIDLRSAAPALTLDPHSGAGWSGVRSGGAGDASLDISERRFFLTPGTTIEAVTTGDGDDFIIGNDASNTIIAHGGADTISGGPGNDSIDGGDGDDTAVYHFRGGTLLPSGDLSGGYYSVYRSGDTVTVTAHGPLNEGVDTLTHVEHVKFSNGTIDVDKLFDHSAGTTGGKISDGGVTPAGGSGNDETAPGAGEIGLPVIGTGSSEPLRGTNTRELIQGLDGDDTLTGYGGQDTLDGGDGSDTADYSYEPAGINATIDLAAGTASFPGYYTETLTSIENVWSGAGNDSITGTSAANDLRGGPGDDTITPGAGNDIVYGDWRFSDQAGVDTVVLPYTYGSGYTVSGTTSALRIVGADGDDRFFNVERFQFVGGVVKTAQQVVAAGKSWTGGTITALTTSGVQRLDTFDAGAVSAIAALPDGRYVLTWTSLSGTQAIKMVVMNADGTPSGAVATVNTTSAGGPGGAAVGSLGDGKFVIAWTDASASGADTSGTSVRFQFFNSDGTKFGAETVANVTTAGNQVLKSVVEYGDGRVLLTWSNDGGSSYSGRAFWADGSPVGGEFSLAYPPQSAIVLADRNILLSWTSWTTASGVHVQAFNQSGVPVGSDITVNQGPAALPQNVTACQLSDGNIALVWFEAPVPGSQYKYNARVVAADGTPVSDQFTIDTMSNYEPQVLPAMQALSDGLFVVAFDRGGGASVDVRAHVYDSAGTSIFQSSVDTAPAFAVLATIDVQVLPGDGFVVAWTDGGAILTRKFALAVGGSGAPTAQNDVVPTYERGVFAGNLLADNGAGLDTDPDGDPLTVATINGVAGNVGHLITLPSGATLTVNPDGRFVYDPNHAFDALGAGASGTDSFTYAVSDGFGHTSSATVTVNITGELDGLRVTNASGAIIGTAADDEISAGDGNDTISGGASFDWLQGGGGADVISGEQGNDILEGGVGDDWLVGGDGFDYIDGGDGADTAKYSGRRGDYAISTDADGNLIIVDSRPNAPDVVDTVVNVEAFEFADGKLALADIQDHAPTFGGIPSFAVLENTGAGVVLGTIVAADIDAGDVLQFTLTNNAASDNSRFSIDVLTGALSFIVAPDFEHPSDPDHVNRYQVEVQVSDAKGLLATNFITVVVQNVDEATTGGITQAKANTGTTTFTATNTVSDLDIVAPNAVATHWQTFSGGVWTDIAGATAASFTAGAAQVGKLLRASADFTDPASLGSVHHVIGTTQTAMIGDAAANTLASALATSGAGTGPTTLIGLGGNDTYLVGQASDQVIEAAGAAGGSDTVGSGLISINLRSFSNVENGFVTGAGSLSVTGNAADNFLYGDTSTGSNHLTGDLGNDTLTVGVGDTADGGVGTDTLRTRSALSLDLEATVSPGVLRYVGFERLQATGTTAASLSGTSGNDVLDGETSSGANHLYGRAGYDFYIVGAGDVVHEGAADGTDTIQSSTISLDLGSASFVNVEIAQLAGTAALNLTAALARTATLNGNNAHNVLAGGGIGDRLYGAGGQDDLYGGAGTDRFIFKAVTDSRASVGIDRIMDFALGDKIDVAAVDPAGAGSAFVYHALGDAAPVALGDMRQHVDVDGTTMVVDFYVTSTAVPSMTIKILNHSASMAAADFML